AFAAYSGAGGTINATLTHWLRDKGFGMAGTIGLAPTVIHGKRLAVAREGAAFEPTEANLVKWREWWRYLRADLCYLWTVGCLIGMGRAAPPPPPVLPPPAPPGGGGGGGPPAGAPCPPP